MAEARSRQLWLHTSHLLAWLGNCHSDKARFRPAQFDPHHEASPAADASLSKGESRAMLAAVFRKGRNRKG